MIFLLNMKIVGCVFSVIAIHVRRLQKIKITFDTVIKKSLVPLLNC